MTPHNKVTQDVTRDKRLRFSIRKFNVGVASVAVAAFFMVGGGTASADQLKNQPAAAIEEVAPTAEDTEEVAPEPELTMQDQEESELSPISQIAETLVADPIQASVTIEPAVSPVSLQPQAMTYKVVYRHAATGEILYSEHRTLVLADGQTKETATVSEVADLSKISGYKLADGQASDQVVTLSQVGRVVTFTVTEDETTSPVTLAGGAGFRSAANSTVETVVTNEMTITEVNGAPATSLPTTGFTTTEPTPRNMNGTRNTVYHDASKYTFAALDLDATDFFLNNTTKAFQTFSGVGARRATQVTEIAFSTDEDGSGNVYAQFYAANGNLLNTEIFPKDQNKEVVYGNDYRIYYSIREENGKSYPTISFDKVTNIQGWFDEIYTNYATALGNTNGNYVGYGYFVPTLVDKVTEYRVDGTNDLIGTVTQTQLAGYRYTASAPDKIVANGNTYELIPSRTISPTGRISNLVNVGDVLSVGTHANHVIRYELLDASGRLAWQLLTPTGQVARDADSGRRAEGILTDGRTGEVTVVVQEHLGNLTIGRGRVTYYVNNPYFEGGKTTYYYRQTAAAPKVAEIVHEFKSGTEGKELPQAVKDLLPPVKTNVAYETTERPVTPTSKKVEDGNESWTFEGYDKETELVDQPRETFIGTWTVAPKTEAVTETEEVTRTINYVTDQGEPVADPFTSTVTFTRTGTKNLVTGETTWGDWTPTNVDQTLEAQALPTKANYEATSTSGTGYDNISLTTVVSNRDVIATAEDIVETVVYTPKTEIVTETEEVTRTINYVTDQGEPVSESFINIVTFTRTGTKNLVTGETTWNEWTPNNGDKTLDAQPLPTRANYEATSTSGTGYDNISLTTVVSNRDVIATAEDIVETVVYTPKTETVTETEEVTRTINYVTDQGEPVSDSFTSTVTFIRTGTKNLVTGETTWGDWTPTNGDQTLDSQALPTKANYEATSTSGTGYDNISLTTVVANREVAAKAEDIVETVVYTPKKRPNPPIIVPIGRKAQVIHEFVSGTPGKELPEEVKVLTPVPKTDVPYGGTETPVAPSKTSVELADGTWTFTSYNKNRETVNQPTETFVGTWVFAPKTETVTETEEVTRTINYVTDQGEPVAESFTSTVTFTRTGTKNLVTGETTWGDWTPTNGDLTLEAQALPTKANYEATSTSGTGYDNVSLTTVVSNRDVIATAEDIVEMVVYTPKIEAVTETEVVTRTINYVTDQGEPVSEPFTSTVTFTRTGTKNLVTGETTWGDWTPTNGDQTLEAQALPAKANYEATSISGTGYDNISLTTVVANREVAAKDEDIVETVVYTPRKRPNPPIIVPIGRKAQVIHEFVSGTPGKELPEEVKSLTPAPKSDVPYGGTETPVAPSKTSVELADGTWTFTSYNKNRETVNQPTETFVGTWTFTPKKTLQSEQPVTTHVDEQGHPVLPPEGGNQPVGQIPGYEPVKTTTDGNGNTIHVYRPTTPATETPVTTHVDEQGHPILPPEGGNQPVGQIPGYEPVKTTTDGNGNTIHVYRPVTPATETPVTTHVDEQGHPILPPEGGHQPVGQIPGYEPIKTTTDGNGNTIHVYRPVTPSTETPVTTHVDEQGYPILPPEGGNQPVGQIPGYEPVKTTTDGNGNTIHVYRPVTPSTETPVTTHVDEQGHPILPPEGGNQPVGQIPGYEPVKTTTDGNGNTIHVYRPVTPSTETPVTTHVDEQGHPILPPEGGNQPVGQIPGYEPVKTTTDGNGNTIHVYRPVTPSTETPVTTHVDENGTPILPPEGGHQPVGQIPGYEPVKTTTDGNGNTIHVYRPVTPSPETPVTTHVDEQGHPILPPEGGNQPVGQIPGYEPVKTTTDGNGNTIHVYRPVTPSTEPPVTTHVDEQGYPILPPEGGHQPVGQIPGYEPVKTTTDGNGNTIHVYRPVTPSTETPVTTHVDENGTPILPPEGGNQPVGQIPGYEPVKTTTDGNGNTIHVYRPVTPSPETPVTTHVDEQGHPILPPEGGNQPVGQIPGYEPVKTTTDGNGNTIHVYRPVTPSTETPVTTHVDEQGHPILPPEGGNQPVGQIPGYEPVKTTTDGNGNTIHVYRPVTPSTETPVTTHVDENGTPILPPEGGNQPVGQIPGYEPVKTTTDGNGNTIHVYRPVTPSPETPVTTHVDEQGHPILPPEGGNQPVGQIPGYEPVKTTTDGNGNTIHVYRPVTPSTETPVTTHVDEQGHPILPPEGGNQPVGQIPGYEPVKTTTDGNGNTIHVYRPVTPSTETPVTTHVDEQGHPILPPEGGNQPVGQIPGYEPVKTTTDSNGNTIHVYRPTIPQPEQPVTPSNQPGQSIVERTGVPSHPTLPNTGDESSANLFAGYGLLSAAVAFGLVGRRRQDN